MRFCWGGTKTTRERAAEIELKSNRDVPSLSKKLFKEEKPGSKSFSCFLLVLTADILLTTERVSEWVSEWLQEIFINHPKINSRKLFA